MLLRFPVPTLCTLCALAPGCTRGDDDPFPGRDAGGSDARTVDATATDAPPLAPTFSSINANIVQAICIDCHTGGQFAAAGMDLSVDPYFKLVGVAAAGPECGSSGLSRVVAGNAASSLVYLKVKAKHDGVAAPCGAPMPKDPVPALSTAQVDVIFNWIENGAAND